MNEVTVSDGHPTANRIFARIEREHRKGAHYLDAAHAAGVDEDMAVFLAETQPAMQKLMELSIEEERPRKSRAENVIVPSPVTRTTVEIKHDYLKGLAAAGLFEKSVQMVAAADPNTDAGARVIEGHLRFVVKDLWPRESNADITKTEEVEISGATEEQLEKRLELLRARREEARAKIVSASEALRQRASGE